ncbi:4-hydroxybenzoate decarboxylase subunit C [Escherichia coli]|nr:4-hydroxybenzoate decarboxylase subunit C [Escherichia coli]
MTTPHGLGYVKMVIMVDEDVDPFNLPQVMWALSSKVNPAGDLVQLPNMSVLELDPGSSPAGIHRQADYRRHHACRPGQLWSLQPAGGGFAGKPKPGLKN